MTTTGSPRPPLTGIRMIAPLRRLFLDHPHEVGESYFQHLGAAWAVAFRLARLSATAMLHGLLPSLARTTVSGEIRAMAASLGDRAEDARETRMRDAGVWDPGL